nr:hypothetical protein [Tanacetum cinerariifolium]
MEKVKTINDEVRIQDLIAEKRVNIKEYSIHHTLKLDDTEGTSCLANAKIFDGLAKMGYEKCLGAKTTSWNEFSSTMASTIICLATNHKFNFSRYILLSLVKNIEAGVPFFMFPRLEEGNRVLKKLNCVPSKVDTTAPVVEKEKSFKQERIIADIDEDVEINLEEAQAKLYKIDLKHPEKRVGSGFSEVVTPLFDNMLVTAAKEVGVDNEEPVDVEEVLEVVKDAKLMTKVVTAVVASTAVKAIKVSIPRRRRCIVIQDPKETTSIVVVHSEVQYKGKGIGILIEEPNSLKGQAQIE